MSLENSLYDKSKDFNGYLFRSQIGECNLRRLDYLQEMVDSGRYEDKREFIRQYQTYRDGKQKGGLKYN